LDRSADRTRLAFRMDGQDVSAEFASTLQPGPTQIQPGEELVLTFLITPSVTITPAQFTVDPVVAGSGVYQYAYDVGPFETGDPYNDPYSGPETVTITACHSGSQEHASG